MVKELKNQIAGALLVILTLAAMAAAGLNFRQQYLYPTPEDGVDWVNRLDRHPKAQAGPGLVEARYVAPNSPADKAGIHVGDVLERIQTVPIEHAEDVPQVLYRIGPWQKADYFILRRGVETKAKLVVGERQVTTAVYYQYFVGIAYIGIGLFVFFRRGGAPRSQLFYILCLASFILCSFHYTGKFNLFDRLIYWGNVVAGYLAPSLFLHFCLTYPEPEKRWRGFWRSAVLYVPAILLVSITFALGTGLVQVATPLGALRWALDRFWMAFLVTVYLLGAAVVTWRQRGVEDSVLRQQMKWVRNGAVLGILPFAIFYALPYAWGVIPSGAAELSVFSLALIPLTWAYAIARYRLMDVDVIFQQGYVYTLATLSVLAIFYGLVYSVTRLGKIEELSPSGFGILIVIATFVFQPIRQWIQENLDRYFFYKESYNYRRTLIEFARELSSETDLDRMLSSTAERLLRTLSIQHLAFFLADEQGDFELVHAAGNRSQPLPEYQDLAFLEPSGGKPYLFFERTRAQLDILFQHLPPGVRQTIGDLDLTYYMPCTVRGRTIAYLGVSRTIEGDFLTSDDVELLMTLSGYVGIAIENARLYNSLQRKVDEYERLKDFSENIVESINVGIMAVDLDDRVESWNHQIERLTGIRRERAVARRLPELLPVELADRLAALRGEMGIHHIERFRLRLPKPAPANGHARQHAAMNSTSGGVAVATAPVQREAILNIAIAPLVSKDGQQIGRIILFDDITDRSELERQLVQADKLSSIGLLAAGVAHEVNTPLAVISTYAQMLAKQVGGDEQKSVLLEKIAKQTFRASEIVNSLLNFSRTSTTELCDVDLNKLVRDTVSLVDHQLREAHVTVNLNLAKSVAPVRGNSGKLQQVLLNLFINARDAMEHSEGKRLNISTVASSDFATIEVSDNGSGIPEEILPRIFDPFFTTKGAKKGTGLGLSVSYGIVQEHGGTILVDSRAGTGTRFRLEFPPAPPHA
ncbi:MAG: PAS domain S-box protein [Bryobacteraceae bacterium]|nr:PAS domain S-box protein [Bryobacteraceae bacterium]